MTTNSPNFFGPDLEVLEPEQRNCEKHGPYEAGRTRVFKNIVATPCPGCSSEQMQAAREKAARERHECIVSQLLRESGVPRRHSGKDFDGYGVANAGQARALNLSKRYAEAISAKTETAGASLLLVGPPGTGKTHLAVAIAEAIARSEQSVRYTTCSELTRRLRATYGRDTDESESDVHNELTKVRLLILDELAATSLSDHERRNLFEIIDTRYRELRPMVLISNLPLNELANVVGERIVDRLHEMATTIAFDWASHRLQKAA